MPLVVDAGHELVYGEPPATAPICTADARHVGRAGRRGAAGGPHRARGGRARSRWTRPSRGRAAGVPNVPAIVAAAASLRATRADRAAEGARLAGLVERIRRQVPLSVADTVVLGADDPAGRLPHLVTFSCLYLDGEALLTELDRRGFAVSSGSSCTLDTLTPSHVLVAMGALTSGNIRVSLHPGVQQADVERFLAALPEAVAAVRSQAPGSPAARPGPQPAAATAGPAVTADSAANGSVLDSRGRRCPLPILDVARALPGIEVGAELTVLADDPAAASDLAAWCRMRGQQLVEQAEMADGTTAYRVRRLQ